MALDLRIVTLVGVLVSTLIYYEQMKVPISVVIPAHNEELTLPKTLEGLLNQSNNNSSMESNFSHPE